MEWLRARLWDDKVMATSLDVQNLETREAFIQQKIAMVEDGSWALKDILDRAEFRVGVAPFPAGPKRKVTLATTDGFGIFAGTRHPEAAWELLKFLVSKDYGLAMARTHFLQPARLSLVPQWVEYIRQEYPNKAKEVDIAAFADGQIQGLLRHSRDLPRDGGRGQYRPGCLDADLHPGQGAGIRYGKGLPADRSHPGQEHIWAAPFRSNPDSPPRRAIAASPIESG